MSFAKEDAIHGWQETAASLQEAIERPDRARTTTPLAEALAAFRLLDDGSEPTDHAPATFQWQLRHDGLTDGQLIYEVCWHRAPLGDLTLSIQPLPDALESPGWTFTPRPPVALPRRLVVAVGDAPDPTDLISWLHSLVDPDAQRRARLHVAHFCLDRLRLASSSNAAAWLGQLQAPPSSLLQYRPQTFELGTTEQPRPDTPDTNRIQRVVVLELLDGDTARPRTEAELAEALGYDNTPQAIETACKDLERHGIVQRRHDRLEVIAPIQHLAALRLLGI